MTTVWVFGRPPPKRPLFANFRLDALAYPHLSEIVSSCPRQISFGYFLMFRYLGFLKRKLPEFGESGETGRLYTCSRHHWRGLYFGCSRFDLFLPFHLSLSYLSLSLSLSLSSLSPRPSSSLRFLPGSDDDSPPPALETEQQRLHDSFCLQSAAVIPLVVLSNTKQPPAPEQDYPTRKVSKEEQNLTATHLVCSQVCPVIRCSLSRMKQMRCQSHKKSGNQKEHN